MFYVITYDVGVERVDKIRKFLRRFLKWEQNSVVVGELTKSQFREVRDQIRSIIKAEEDHVIIFGIRSEEFVDREDLGTPKSKLDGGDLFI